MRWRGRWWSSRCRAGRTGGGGGAAGECWNGLKAAIGKDTHVCIHVCQCVDMYVCMCVCMHVCRCVCVFMCVYVCMYVCVFMCVYVCVFCLEVYYVCRLVCMCTVTAESLATGDNCDMRMTFLEGLSKTI